jgi:hypothetical protein
LAGYLFRHNAGSFSYVPYLRTKLRNVIAPYLLAAAPGIAYELLRNRQGLVPLGLVHAPLWEQLVYFYTWGGTQMNYALWFIPVISLYYLAAPALMAFVKRPQLYLCLLILLPLSTVMLRPSYHHGHNVLLAVYFLPVYLMGMLCREYRQPIGSWLDKHRHPVFIAFAALFTAHLALSAHHGMYRAAEPDIWGQHFGEQFDWMLVQKIMMTIALLTATRWLGSRPAALLDGLADSSFTIYFYHLQVLFFIEWLEHFKLLDISVGKLLFVFAVAMIVPWLIATSAKLAVPRWSRTLVGS